MARDNRHAKAGSANHETRVVVLVHRGSLGDKPIATHRVQKWITQARWRAQNSGSRALQQKPSRKSSELGCYRCGQLNVAYATYTCPHWGKTVSTIFHRVRIPEAALITACLWLSNLRKPAESGAEGGGRTSVVQEFSGPSASSFSPPLLNLHRRGSDSAAPDRGPLSIRR